MSKCKRILPKDESAHFQMKSSMLSWAGIREGSSMREQENKIAGFFHKTRNDVSERYVRRDDYDCGSDGFICETNQILCQQLIELRDSVKTGKRVLNDTVKHEFDAWVKLYVQSLRKLGNLCLVCEKPLKVKKSFIIDGQDKAETLFERKQRLSFKKTVSTKFRTKRGISRLNFKLRQKSIGKYRTQGEVNFSSTIGAKSLFIILTANGKQATMPYLLAMKPIKVAGFNPRIVGVSSQKDACYCLK